MSTYVHSISCSMPVFYGQPSKSTTKKSWIEKNFMQHGGHWRPSNCPSFKLWIVPFFSWRSFSNFAWTHSWTPKQPSKLTNCITWTIWCYWWVCTTESAICWRDLAFVSFMWCCLMVCVLTGLLRRAPSVLKMERSFSSRFYSDSALVHSRNEFRVVWLP